MKTVWVRHGQSEYNAQDIATGWHDPELTELGCQQALKIAEKLSKKYLEIAEIYSSDLRRSHNTAKIIVDNTPWFHDIKVTPAIRERDYGDWSGKNKDQLREELGNDSFLAVRRGWSANPNNGESLKDTAGRVAGFLKELEESTLPHIIVCHGNTIRAASVVLGYNTADNISDWQINIGDIIEWDY